MMTQTMTDHPDLAAALQRFDALDPVGLDFMLGAWRGEGYASGHPLDGALEAYHWWGKRFVSAEEVHPLVFATRSGGTVSLNPRWMAPALGWLDRWPLPKSATLGRLLQWLLPLLSTRRSGARLRLLEHRGKVSAAMIYDRLPIHDVFRRLDDDTVLGLMDLKGSTRPYLFVLRRHRLTP